jgi:hypothetical protein
MGPPGDATLPMQLREDDLEALRAKRKTAGSPPEEFGSGNSGSEGPGSTDNTQTLT